MREKKICNRCGKQIIEEYWCGLCQDFHVPIDKMHTERCECEEEYDSD